MSCEHTKIYIIRIYINQQALLRVMFILHTILCIFLGVLQERDWKKKYMLVLSYLDFKGKILLEVLDNHYEKRKLDAQRLLRVCRTCYVGGTAGTE